MVHQQGTLPHLWTPSGSGEHFTLPQLLAPLEPFRKKLLFVAGVDNKVAFVNQATDGHASPARTLLSAAPYASSLDSNGKLLPKARQELAGLSNGPSIEQEIASRISADTAFRSVDLAVGTHGDSSPEVATVDSHLFYAGRSDLVTSTWKPTAAFDRLFAGLTPPKTPEADRRRARQLSVLDAVRDSFGPLRNRLGREDQERLDAHADKLRSIEKRLAGVTVGATCQLPSRPAFAAGFDGRFDENLSGPVMIDMLTTALACGLSNVATLCFPESHGPQFRWVKSPNPIVPSSYTEWHDMVHRGWDRFDDPTFMEPGLPAGFATYTDQFVSLLNSLEAIPEDGGTMLDHTAVLWISEFGRGSIHSPQKLPIVLAGNLGSIKMGRFVDLRQGTDTSGADSLHCTNQLYTSLLNAFGFPDQSFGFTGAHPYVESALALGGSGTVNIGVGPLPLG